MSIINGRRGFTLLEVAVFIAVLTITIGTLLPVISRPYVSEYRVQTIAEMQAIQRAIIGDPLNGDYGFLGTMGRLPRSAVLSELWVRPNDMNAVSLSADTGVLNGWNGPYLRALFHRPEKDAWGQDYVIETDTGGKWRVRSYGPDGTANTSDDIILSKGQTSTDYLDSLATVTVSLLLSDGQLIRPVSSTVLTNGTGLPTTEVQVFFPRESDAAETSKSCTITPEDATATCSGVPFGLRHFRVTSTAGLFPAVDLSAPVLRPLSTARIYLDPAVSTTRFDTYSIPVVGKTTSTFPITVSSGSSLQIGTATIDDAGLPNRIPVRHVLDVQAAGSVTPSSDTTTCTVSVRVNNLSVPASVVTLGTSNSTPMTIPFQVLANRDMPNATDLDRAVGAAALTVDVFVQASGGDCAVAYPATAGQRFGSVLAYVVQ